MKIQLGHFADASIAARLGSDRTAGVRAALRRYACRLESGTRPAAFPRFRALGELDGAAAAGEVDIMLDGRMRRTFEREARRQAISLEQLVTHAVLVYLADVD